MRTAHARARAALNAQPIPEPAEIWGWRARTLSQAVTTTDGRAWLRLASSPPDQIATAFWNGAADAEHAIPATIPRPRLQALHEWQEARWAYRAELYHHAPVPVASPTAVLTQDPAPPASWWGDLRSALKEISDVHTERLTAFQPFLDHAMPRYLGTPIDTRAPSWSTAHGDLHFANLGVPRLYLFDWEGWGLAPTGYDAATLHTYSLLVPSTAARIRAELAHLLNTPAGRFAELVVITEFLHGVARGRNAELHDPLLRRAEQLLERALPRM